jgi:hypothetical protein
MSAKTNTRVSKDLVTRFESLYIVAYCFNFSGELRYVTSQVATDATY